MPRIVYNHHTEIHFRANELMVYVQLAAQARFRAGQGFFFTAGGKHDNEDERRTARWFHPSIPLEFYYDDEPQFEIQQETVEAFISRSRSEFGLNLAPEDAWVFARPPEKDDEDSDNKDSDDDDSDESDKNKDDKDGD